TASPTAPVSPATICAAVMSGVFKSDDAAAVGAGLAGTETLIVHPPLGFGGSAAATNRARVARPPLVSRDHGTPRARCQRYEVQARITKYAAGAANKKASSRSSMPPCPPSRLP